MSRLLQTDQRLNMIIILALLTMSASAFAQPKDFQLVAENGHLRLYFNPGTTEIAVENISSGGLWYTNPQERHSTSGFVLNRLSSQLTIVHDPDSVQKDNHRYSIAYNQFEIMPLDNGIRVEYTIVEEWKPEHYVPKMIKQERMEEMILAEIEAEKDRSRVLEFYNLITLVPLAGERTPIPGVNQERVFGEYDLMILNEDYQNNLAQLQAMKQELESALEDSKAALQTQINQLEQKLRKEKEDIVWRLLYTIVDHRLDIEKSDYISFADVEHLIDSPTYLMELIPRFYLTEVQKIIIGAGYTPIECAEDHIMNNLDPILAGLQTFKVPLEYTLDGDNLLVRIPSREIEYPIDVENRIGEKFTYPLHTIRVLENFHAADTAKEGYIFVPDGSGALIYLNNGKLFTSGYNDPVFGRDNTLDTPSEMQRYPQQIRLPVFGLKQNDQAIFAIIEEGASLARIKADISGRTDDYNRVYAEFVPLPNGRVSISVQTDNVDFSGQMPVYQARKYEGDFVIRYAFLSGDEATYAGMARYYRDYLIQKYGLNRVAAKEHIPFYLELVGAIDKREPILGIARDVIHPLTTFAQAQSILTSLKSRGIENIQVKYNGWLKGGLDHRYPDKAALEQSLGGVQDLKNLIGFVTAEGCRLYPSVGFLQVYRDTLFDSFNPRRDGAQLLNRLVAKTYRYRLDTYGQDRSRAYYVLSPREVGSLVDSFLADYRRYNLLAINLLDLGSEVNSDFLENAAKVVDREQSLAVNLAQMEKIQRSGLRMMFDQANIYALPYADSIVNMPIWGSSYQIVDEEIPFYQMVVHGLVDYAAHPLNLSSDPRRDLLRMVECGSYPYFIGCYQPSYEVKGTRFNHLYAMHYGDWLGEASEVYELVSAVFHDVQDQLIVDHCRLMDNVYQTVYENGKRVIVNYNLEPVEVNGRIIAGQDFVVMEGGADEN